MDVAKASKYYLKVSTFNATNHLLVEAPQSSPAPIVREVKDGQQVISFFEVFHLQFPLDNLEDKSYVVIELLESIEPESVAKPAVAGAPVIDYVLHAWGKVVLDRNEISTETRHLSLFVPGSDDIHAVLEMELVITKR